MTGPICSNDRRRFARLLVAFIAAVVVGSAGCAYFNTFYNAKSEFNRAEDERKLGGSGQAGYQKSIEKCQSLLRYYPKSKYVDDALFLMGMSRFHREEYVQSRAVFEDLFERFPQSEYIERARYYNGYAALRQGDIGAASQAFATLQKEFPESKLNIEAVFRQAEARLDARDYDTARAELRAFMAAHPKSTLAAEAQLRLARTYQDEHRYAEAKVEFDRVLEQNVTDAVRYEARLSSALALRAIAAEVLSDPALQPAPPDSATIATALAAGDTLATQAPPKLTAEQDSILTHAYAQIDEVWSRLQDIRKPAAKLGKQIEHDIEVAVTRALGGEPDEAMEDLDQIARTRPKTAESARARYEIGEIHRRRWDLDAARKAYDDATREQAGMGLPIVELARKRSTAIGARKSASERLVKAPSVLRQWREAGSSLSAAVEEPLDAALADTASGGADSAAAVAASGLAPRLALAAEFEALAAEQLRIAEIDLLDLDQPLIALREFEQILVDYAGSLQAPRAAFAIAWIQDHRLRNPQRARTAYQRVAEDFAESPQGRAARDILAHWDDPRPEVEDPFSRP